MAKQLAENYQESSRCRLTWDELLKPVFATKLTIPLYCDSSGFYPFVT